LKNPFIPLQRGVEHMLTSVHRSKTSTRISIASLLATLLFGVFNTANILINTKQINETNKRIAESSKIAQASKVSAWVGDFDGDQETVWLDNESDVPVYRVFVLMVTNNQTLQSPDELASSAIRLGTFGFVETLPPGKHAAKVSSFGPSAGGHHAIPMIYFTDSRNIEWLRSSSGALSTASNYEHHLNLLGLNPPYSVAPLK
jgi:hypothetical protein